MSEQTRGSWQQLGQIDPDLEKYLEEHVEPRVVESVENRRRMAALYNDILLYQLAGETPGIRRTEVPYTSAKGIKHRAVLYQPDDNNSTSARPLVVMIHGGGFLIGVPEYEEMLCRNLVRSFGAVCYSISYTLSLDAKFPRPVEDAIDALQFAAKNASAWGADPYNKGFIVGGCSAGGNLAAVLTLWARDNGTSLPPITGQYLQIPWLTVNGKVPEEYEDVVTSYEQITEAPCLPRDAIDVYRDAYAPIEHDDRFDVLHHSRGFTNLPPTYFQVCGLDPLRDEGLVYEDMLKKANVSTKLDVYPGLPHFFWFFYSALKKQALKFRQEQLQGFSWLLKQRPDPKAVLEL